MFTVSVSFFWATLYMILCSSDYKMDQLVVVAWTAIYLNKEECMESVHAENHI